MQDDRTLTSDDLVRELARLDVPFLLNDLPPADGEAIEAARMLAALASDDNARMRLALIPLLLRRPDYAEHAPAVAKRLDGESLVYLKCYCTAAVLLQGKYADRLRELGLPVEAMPDWFAAELAVPAAGEADERLAALGRVQAALSGRDFNWVGTYEHGALSFLRFRSHILKYRQAQNDAEPSS